MVIAVDFDDTIHDTQNVPKGYKLGKPVYGAELSLSKIKADGHTIVIHSVWANSEQRCQAMAEWCKYFGIPYDFITNEKPVADLYVDDKGYRFRNWEDTLAFVDKLS